LGFNQEWITKLNQEWITKLNLPQILSKTIQQQQAQPSLQHPSKGFGFFKA